VSVKLAQTDAEKLACFPVMKELRTHLEEAEFMPQLEPLSKAQLRSALLHVLVTHSETIETLEAFLEDADAVR
jgi:ribosomal protein S4